MLVFSSTKSPSRGVWFPLITAIWGNTHLYTHILFILSFVFNGVCCTFGPLKQASSQHFQCPQLAELLASPHTKSHKCKGIVSWFAQDSAINMTMFGFAPLMGAPKLLKHGGVCSQYPFTSNFGTLRFPPKTRSFASFSFSTFLGFIPLLELPK